ncbi:ATP-grasp target RiPP [Stackebrandtia soli]
MSFSSAPDNSDFGPGVRGGSERPFSVDDDDDDFLEEDALWMPSQQALPPVIGRYDKDSGERLMHYSDDVIQGQKKDDDFDWNDGDGTSIDIGF